ncbi:V/A-type H+-transporting ATPase subunit E [Anaerotaenia torta]|uniref:V-type ATP synthase subunit E n=1 Tax=Anaerotaenia torta TaxID=433293 RepID=UPI003D19FE77
MTGLEKILEAIEADARKEADAVIAKAKGEAEVILAEARKEAEVNGRRIAEKSEEDVRLVRHRAESAAVLQEKKMILDSKQQIISNIITSARNKLSQMPSSEYTDIILSIIKKHAHNEQGEILISDADKRRLTPDFAGRLTEALKDKPGAQLRITEGKPGFEGGFLLVYGDVEENCSLDALFAEQRENLLDKVNSLLFE